MRKTGKIVLIFLVLLALGAALFYHLVSVSEPEVDMARVQAWRRVPIDSGFRVGAGHIRQNRYGLYEMVVESSDFEGGYMNGLLSKELIRKQEQIFVDKLDEMLPGRFYQQFLRLTVGWMNRNLDQYIDTEYLREIYGVSRAASSDYDFIAPAYQRMLNYHAAHDIGHAMQNLNLVACSSFGVWGSQSVDSSILIGRNFDFYMGEAFAKDKIVAFVKPNSGLKYMSVTWGGFIGVVSGMNEKGLTVTLNAAKSGIPTGAKTPVSIIGRKILQYASTIAEAHKIASSYESFVTESFMVGSKIDGKVAIIEKTPEKTTLLYPDEERITCTNHFQCKAWDTDSLNIQNVRESPSAPRQNRLRELLAESGALNPGKVASILRNRFGPANQDLGMGNEKALNQFVAHHSIIFNPTKGLVWVSATPYQLGAYVAYDLNKIFSNEFRHEVSLFQPDITIPADDFLHGEGYRRLLIWKKTTEDIRRIVRRREGTIPASELAAYKASNPAYFFTWMLLGDYYTLQKENKAAKEAYLKALTLDIPRTHDKEQIETRLAALQETR